jgi:hypothetical protein
VVLPLLAGGLGAVAILAGCTPFAADDAGAEGGSTATATSTPVNPIPSDPADIATDTAVATGTAVTVTSAAWVPDQGIAVSSVVLGRVEDGGTCTLTATFGDDEAEVSGDALADASSTTCGELVVPDTDVDTGTWTVRVTYTSPDGSTGTSEDEEVEVP